MKSVMQVKDTAETEYPCLMVGSASGYIYLMLDDRKGIIVNTGGQPMAIDRELGEIVELSIDSPILKPYNGEVVLSNG